MLNKVFSPGYFAREDTRSPMRFAIVSVAVNLTLSLTLSRIVGHVGIAVATAVAAWVNAGLLGVVLARRGHYSPDDRLRRRIPRIILSSLVMGAILIAGNRLSVDVFAGGGPLLVRTAVLAALIVAGLASYFGTAHLVGAMTLAELRAMLRR